MDLDVLAPVDQLLHGDLDIVVGVDEEEHGGEIEDIDIVDDGSSLDAETNHFNRIVGALETILIDPDFDDARDEFCRTHCISFDPLITENTLHQMNLFSQYTTLLEGTIETSLQSSIPGFDMQQFIALMQEKKDHLMSDVFDLLLSIADYETFRDLMISYRLEMDQLPFTSEFDINPSSPSISSPPGAGGAGGGLGSGVEVGVMNPLSSPSSLSSPSGFNTKGGGGFGLTVTSLRVHTEEQEDGDVRPDLDGFGFTISSPKGPGGKGFGGGKGTGAAGRR